MTVALIWNSSRYAFAGRSARPGKGITLETFLRKFTTGIFESTGLGREWIIGFVSVASCGEREQALT